MTLSERFATVLIAACLVGFFVALLVGVSLLVIGP